MGIRVRQGRRHGVVGVEAPGFLWGPHSVLEGSLNLVVILVGDLDVLESTVDDGELQGVTRLQLGDRVVRGERQSCWGRGRSGRRGRGRPTGGAAGTRTVLVQGRLGASCNGHWQSHGTCGQNRTPGQSRRHSTSMFCVCEMRAMVHFDGKTNGLYRTAPDRRLPKRQLGRNGNVHCPLISLGRSFHEGQSWPPDTLAWTSPCETDLEASHV